MPLHRACENDHADVQFLAGRKCHLNPRDNFQKTPLIKTVEHQHKDCVAILLEHGASPDLKGAGGNTALHLAVAIPSKSLVELLLEHKAHINAQNELGYTPLTLAITKHCEEMVEFLLEKGADVHARDKHRRTPLMVAAAAGDMNVIQLLLWHGADLSHEDPFGYTAVYYARVFQHDDIANQLEEYMRCERMGERSAGGTEGPAALDSSCSGTTADFPLGTASRTGAGVLPAAGAEQEKDVDSLWDSETDSEGPGKVLASVLLLPGDGCRLHAQSVAEERSNGVLPAAGAEQEKDVDSSWDSETDSEGPGKVLASVLLLPGDGCRLHAQSVAEERSNGVLPAAGAEQEKDVDSSWDSETDSEGPGKVLASMPKKDASTQTDCCSNRQKRIRQLQQELADTPKKNSLTETSLKAKKHYTRDLQEQKLQLQKELDRSKAKLQELKARNTWTEYYAVYLKNAIKERELTTSRNLQGLLLDVSSATVTITELEEHIKRLQVGKAKLKATVQQQVKTIEALQKDLQAFASVS
ncbi:uncharacterized protein LOC141944371 [Strix uralensis]|uniref:uncharacterized protein LOC141944371 n=1 Tax=Strix uralensis TaxID=36305 RepID=UPI003DA763F1